MNAVERTHIGIFDGDMPVSINSFTHKIMAGTENYS
jgi:hypothetical protein